jgi:trans-2,3-dihydro-3-hydroxyanthranilate isomerase
VTTFRYVLADVFTDRPLEGNGLAVFTDAREIPEALLQPLAREMNLSETVFVYPAEGEGHARMRIFTPVSELPFAGHPVLGTAFVLAGPLQLPEIRLETGVGIVPVALEREEGGGELLAALGVGGSGLPLELYESGLGNVYVLLADEQAVAAVVPDLSALAEVMGTVHANCVAGSGNRWKTRMFAPADGVPEDPATGSAAGPLACHLARHGRIGFGEEIEISQGAEIGRPSALYARVEGSPERIERVEVGGSAVIVARGEFRI